MDSLTPQSELGRLNREYRGWKVWRSRNGDALAGWVASNLDPRSQYDPTLHGETAEALELLLMFPPLRIGRLIIDEEATL